MNIKKSIFLMAFFIFSGRVCFGMVGDDGFKDMPDVKKIKEIKLKIVENNIEARSNLILNNIQKTVSFGEEKFFTFMNKYDQLTKETLNPISQNCYIFCSLIQQSISIEDVYYSFFLDKNNSLIYEFMKSFDVQENIKKPVENFLENDFIKTIPHYDDLKVLLNEKMIKDFIVPVKDYSKNISDYLNTFLTSNSCKQRVDSLRISILKEIKEKKEEFIKEAKKLRIKNDRIFLSDLHDMLHDFSLYITQDQKPLEEIINKVNDLSEKNYRISDDKIEKFIEEQEEKYKKIKRDFLVLTSPILYNFKPTKKPNLSLSSRSRFLIFLSLFSSGAYLLYRFMPKKMVIEEMKWKIIEGTPFMEKFFFYNKIVGTSFFGTLFWKFLGREIPTIQRR